MERRINSHKRKEAKENNFGKNENSLPYAIGRNENKYFDSSAHSHSEEINTTLNSKKVVKRANEMHVLSSPTDGHRRISMKT